MYDCINWLEMALHKQIQVAAEVNEHLVHYGNWPLCSQGMRLGLSMWLVKEELVRNASTDLKCISTVFYEHAVGAAFMTFISLV